VKLFSYCDGAESGGGGGDDGLNKGVLLGDGEQLGRELVQAVHVHVHIPGGGERSRFECK